MNAVIDVKKVMVDSVHQSRLSGEWFIKNILNQLDECDPWQIEVVEAVLDVWRKENGHPTVANHEGLNRITIVSCHGTGKTHVLALILHAWNYCFYGLVVGTAPKQDQIKTRFMPRYRKIKRAANEAYQKLSKVDTLKVSILGDSDWGYIGETASEPENMAGYHDTPQLILVDEASAKTLDPMFPVIEGALTTKGSVLVEIGNPTRSQGEFWASHNKKGTKELYYKVHVKPKDSRYVSQEWVDTMIAKYGEQSPVVQVRVFGNFVEQDANQLIALSWLEDARHEWEPDGSIRRLKVTCDVADGGEDETVITVAYQYDTFTVFKSIHRFSFPPAKSPIMAAEAMIRIAEAHNYDISYDYLIVDGIGVGAGTAGYLIKQNKFNVIVFKGGATENVDTKKWRNQRVRSSIVFRDGLRDNTIYFDPDFCTEADWDDFTAQACSIRTKIEDERVEDLVSKKEMKTEGIKSPDMFDSAYMIFANQSPQLSQSTSLEVVGEMETAHADW
ncbi:MAG TPA: hypothetical protein ENJ28_01170 [Gammaproteobacteria bacterium]|nr:hypothetical protein [Gammaproteobacteria bacterium]